MIDIKYDFFESMKSQAYANEIFHYTSPDGLKKILEGNSLRFSNAYFLNDKSEIIYTYDLISKILPALKNELEEELYLAVKNRYNYVLNPEFFDQECSVIGREDFYIASFSTDGDSLSMWNNYTKTDSKTGYAIKFEAMRLLFNLKNSNQKSFIEGALVCYDKKKQEEVLINTIRSYNEEFKKAENKEFVITKLIYNFIVFSLFFKHHKFEQEKEYRIIIGNRAHVEDKRLDFDIQNGLFVPFILLQLSEKTDVENRIIEEIKVSPVSDKLLTRYSLNKLLNKTGYNSLTLTFSDIPLRY